MADYPERHARAVGRSKPTAGFGPDDETPVFVISVAAQLAGMHAQTLRQYDRLGLVSPSRTRGGGRRYSGRDVALLREVQRLSQEEGISLAGVQHILQLRTQVDQLRDQIAALTADLASQLEGQRRTREAGAPGSRIFAAGRAGDIVTVRPGQRPPRYAATASTRSQAVVLWTDPRQR